MWEPGPFNTCVSRLMVVHIKHRQISAPTLYFPHLHITISTLNIYHSVVATNFKTSQDIESVSKRDLKKASNRPKELELVSRNTVAAKATCAQ